MMIAILATNKNSLIQQWYVYWVLGTRLWSTMESGFQMNESFVHAGSSCESFVAMKSYTDMQWVA
jgi:hypothetical protein